MNSQNLDSSWFLMQGKALAEQNLLITDASERIPTATMLGCASRVILKSIPMVLVCGKDSNTPAVKYAEYSGYDIRYADLDSGASELLEPGDGKCPVATILEAGEGGMTHAQSGIVLGRILEYVCGANNHPNLAILIDDLPALGQVPHIENALAMSSKINVRFCMTAEHMSEVAAAYPATHIKIIENCKVFFLNARVCSGGIICEASEPEETLAQKCTSTAEVSSALSA